MAYQVTFATGRMVTIHDAAWMNGAQIRERAIQLHGFRDYRYCEKAKRAVLVDIEVPAIARVQQMREVYQGGGYCLVPVGAA